MKVHILLLVIIVSNVYDYATGSEPPPVILVASRLYVKGILISTGEKFHISNAFASAIDVDFDYEDKRIFIDDISHHKIYA